MVSKNEDKVRELCEKSIQLFNAGDFDGVAELYTTDTQFLAPGFTRINSKEGVRKFWQTTFGAGYKFESIDTIELKADEQLAYWLFGWVMSNPAEDGSKVTNTGKNVLIWEKTASGWLICLDSWNSPA